ncbi:hypothetical protein PMAYCL1PPCAC_16821, partial [Pristionchus mayeri]
QSFSSKYLITEAYNRSLQMTSMTCERELSGRSNPFVKINGAIYHQMSGYKPEKADCALFNQIYQYNPEFATEERMRNPNNSGKLKENIVRDLSHFFHKNNYLAKQFRATSKIERALKRANKPVREKILTLRAPTRSELNGNHPGTMSRPKQELISALYRTDEQGSGPTHGVWVYPKGNRMTQLPYFDPLTDPLCYPLMFQFGEEGYRYGQYKLFPKGTKRSEAGFSYPQTESDIPHEEEIVEAEEQENDEDVGDFPRDGNELEDDHLELSRSSNDSEEESNRRPIRYSTSKQYTQPSIDDSATEETKNEMLREADNYAREFEADLKYEPGRKADDEPKSQSPVEFLYSSDDEESARSISSNSLAEIAAVLFETDCENHSDEEVWMEHNWMESSTNFVRDVVERMTRDQKTRMTITTTYQLRCKNSEDCPWVCISKLQVRYTSDLNDISRRQNR